MFIDIIGHCGKGGYVANEMEERISSSLLTFIDFLYAVVFGLMVERLFTDVLSDPSVGRDQKAIRIVMTIAAFYFLAWDWLHGRMLTFKNPYARYLRFLLEILIAACAFGVVFAALRGSIYLLLFIALVLFLGVWWAKVTLGEYPLSKDKEELTIIKKYQSVAAVIALTVFSFYLVTKRMEMDLFTTIFTVLGGWAFVFVYELDIEREKGILGGPGMPFLNRERMERMRQRLRKRKGS